MFSRFMVVRLTWSPTGGHSLSFVSGRSSVYRSGPLLVCRQVFQQTVRAGKPTFGTCSPLPGSSQSELLESTVAVYQEPDAVVPSALAFIQQCRRTWRTAKEASAWAMRRI